MGPVVRVIVCVSVCLCVCCPPDVTESTFDLAVDQVHQQGKSLLHDASPEVTTPANSQKGPQSEPVGVSGGWCTSVASLPACGYMCTYVCAQI